MKELLVNSAPSKDFFIKMITKDVSVESCILDLIDNAIDSHKMQKNEDASLIKINFSLEDDFFSICDDCGGMTKTIAQEVAFKFGNERERDSGTLGMYGIGMKRSIFKIGEDFVVYSKTANDSFKVFMNQEEWLTLKNGKDEIWKFYYEDCENDFNDGVHIVVKKLSASLREYLNRPANIDKLKKKIGNAYRDLLAKNIKIEINEEPVEYISDVLYESDILKTYVKTIDSIPGMKIKIIAGIGDPKPKLAGWNIISNGRAIIENNKDELTGWDAEYDAEEDNVDEVLNQRRIPAYHNDFARFRGFVFMYSNDSNLLPLNTTKDGIDEQHKIYRYILKEMSDALKIILPKLREFVQISRTIKNAGKIAPEDSFVSKEVSDYYSQESAKFKLEVGEYKESDTIKNISIKMPVKQVEFLKDFFDVQTNKDLGENILKFLLERIDLQDE